MLPEECIVPRNSYAETCLRELGNAGCDRHTILKLLGSLSGEQPPLLTDWELDLGGMRPEDIRALKKRTKQLAREIKKLSRTTAGWLGLIATKDELLQRLPVNLSNYCRFLDELLKVVGPRRNVYFNLALARLILYVKDRTGRFCDSELAELVSEVTGREGYPPQAHRQWRYRNLSKLSKQFPILLSARRLVTRK